jgi:uncharacterized protein (TIGR02001 family)
MKLLAASAIGVATGMFASAHAERSWGRLIPQAEIASDYRFDGVSESDREPTAQLSIYWWRPDNYYAGVFITGAHFHGFGDTTTSYEIDTYVGKNFQFESTRLAIEAMYSSFPDNKTPGPTYDFLQLKGKAQRAFGSLMLDGAVSWVPQASYGSGTAWRIAGGPTYKWNAWLSTSANYGYRWVERGYDRAFWDAGVTAKWKKLALDVRYYDTSLSRAQCFFVDVCDSAIVSKITIDLY